MILRVILWLTVGIAVGADPPGFSGPPSAAAEEAGGGRRPRLDSRPELIRRVALGDFGSDYVRIGDLDGDGRLDLLCIQAYAPGDPPGFQGGEHVSVITCLTAIDLEGCRL